ncbi:MAG: hypothetical protein AAGD13_05895 [Pseudomonadota bacterium]
MAATILTIAGIFAGIGVFLATMYSVTQILLLEGLPRIAHFVQLVLILTVMWSLYWWRDVVTAQIVAAPLLAAALWTSALEVGWYRVFPLLVSLFAIAMLTGYIALTPL